MSMENTNGVKDLIDTINALYIKMNGQKVRPKLLYKEGSEPIV